MLSEGDGSAFEESLHLNRGAASKTTDCGNVAFRDEKTAAGEGGVCCRKLRGHKVEMRQPPSGSCSFDSLEESPLVSMVLYVHRVNSLVLALLVEPRFMGDSASMEEVVRKTTSIRYYTVFSSFS